MEQISKITSNDDFVDVRMSTEEFLEWMNRRKEKNKLVKKGLAGIMSTFSCSKNQAFKIAHQEWFAPCRIQMGKHLVFDAELAWKLAKEAGY